MKLINFIKDKTLVDAEKIIGIYQDGKEIQIDAKDDYGYCIEKYTYDQVVSSIIEALNSNSIITTAREY